ncbi:hypothetical protein BO86DRAFT_90569 [Aspergillus japonicus CBS 114.51]|uniref:Uncharacterized protein n=1 Tax=Aspergillus japonicus CBS 114.51 TaxID=1448312 RepID=A0A8T8X1C2_ASPJA|nr:hypothetical protein BO86DRAFT_90569 [Aspergillus japonicus CBS 114.51]RAH81893.1 hypothetical protein BO86DRAFT_90569 [Aspergillus japonicus CBS 114.51]
MVREAVSRGYSRRKRSPSQFALLLVTQLHHFCAVSHPILPTVHLPYATLVHRLITFHSPSPIESGRDRHTTCG